MRPFGDSPRFYGSILFAFLAFMVGAAALGLAFADSSLVGPGQLAVAALAVVDAAGLMAWLAYARSRRRSDDQSTRRALPQVLLLGGIYLLASVVAPAAPMSAVRVATAVLSLKTTFTAPATVAPRSATAGAVAQGTTVATLSPRFLVSGRVTSARSGEPLAGVTVVLDFGGGPGCCQSAEVTTTDAAGRYAAPVDAGTYRVLFNPKFVPGFGVTWWPRASSFATAADLKVGPGHDSSSIDAALPAGHDLSGTVSGPAGPLYDVGVFAYVSTPSALPALSDFVVSTRTLLSGSYHLPLADGSYRIAFSQPGSNRIDRWWNVESSSDLVSVLRGGVIQVQGSSVAGLDVLLPVSAR